MTQTPEEFLAHYGVKGMRWGKRHDDAPKPKKTIKLRTESRSVKLKDGSKLILSGDKTPLPARLLAKVSPRIRKNIETSENFTLKSSDGKTVGNMFLYQKKSDELNVAWVEVNPKHRGKGYASAAMQGAVDLAKDKNLKKVTLEVPGNSPDARHIYEKMGFKAGKQISSSGDMWGGLTEMQLDL
ncbi:acetyltransferase [Arthrobacter phage Shepard]|nr:acetyltransferase [Arthrobacter phage Shepard]